MRKIVTSSSIFRASFLKQYLSETLRPKSCSFSMDKLDSNAKKAATKGLAKAIVGAQSSLSDDDSSGLSSSSASTSFLSLPNSIECRIVTPPDGINSTTGERADGMPRLHVTVRTHPKHLQQQHEQLSNTGHQNHSKIISPADSNHKSDGNDNTHNNDATSVIPDSVLQYERQLRKVQASNRSLAPLNMEQHLHILFEDDHLIVVDKPAGVLCVPGLNNKPSILDLIQEHLTKTARCNNDNTKKKRQRTNARLDGGGGDTNIDSNIINVDEVQLSTPTLNEDTKADPSKMIVHRLDMDTSGVVVFAKTQTCQKALQAKFRDKSIDDSLLKEYHALVCGHINVKNTNDDDATPSDLEVDHGDIFLPLKRDHRHPPFMRIATPRSEAEAKKAVNDLQTHGFKKLINKAPKESHTEFSVLGRERLGSIRKEGQDDGDYDGEDGLPITRVLLIPHTGRTHQLRVHMSAIGHPILGDSAYGLYGEANPRGGCCFDEFSTTKSDGVDVEGLNDTRSGKNRRVIVPGASLHLQQKLLDLWPSPDKCMCLHAARLRLRHPITNDIMEWCATTPF